MLSSLNGNIARFPQEGNEHRLQNGMTCPADQIHLKKWTAKCDCVFIGWKSILAEKNAFSVKDFRADKREVPWIIFTSNLKIAKQHPFLLQEKIPFLFFQCTSFDPTKSPEFEEKGQKKYAGNILGLFQYLSSRGVVSASLLGGGVLNSKFWTSQLVDTLHLTLSPTLFQGNKSVPMIAQGTDDFFQNLTLKTCQKEQNFIFITYEKTKKAV